MRRTNPVVAAVVGAVAALLLIVAFPGLGIGEGETYSSHGGPPDVYTQTHPDDLCAQLDKNGTQSVANQEFNLEATSNVTILYEARLGELAPRETVFIGIGLDGNDTNQEWGFTATGSSTAAYFSGRGQAFVMWTLDHISAGFHSVQIFGRVTGGQFPSADLNGCALTVLVSTTIE